MCVVFQRTRYPRGFYILSVVQDSDELCREEEPEEVDWLWEAAVLAQQLQSPGEAPPPRRKTLTLHTRAALSRAQYLVGAGVTLALFLLFYVLFGALVLVQRWPRWKRLVGPRAVLARSQSNHMLDQTSPTYQLYILTPYKFLLLQSSVIMFQSLMIMLQDRKWKVLCPCRQGAGAAETPVSTRVLKSRDFIVSITCSAVFLEIN